MKKKHKQSNLDAWLKTASPFLIRKRTPNTQVVYSKRGFKLTKKQIKGKNRAARKLWWKSQHPKKAKKEKREVMPKYKVYILSKKWRARCALFYKMHGKFCVACGETRNIHLHHMSYQHMGNELDGELAPLCRDCHKEYHELNGVQRDMIKKTCAFIEDKQQIWIP
jgi:hypothetical protein